MKFLFVAIMWLVGAAVMLSSCSSGGGGGGSAATTTLNSAATAVTGAKAKINGALVMNPSANLVSGLSKLFPMNAGWTAVEFSTASDCGDMTTPKGQIQLLQDPTCTTAPIFDVNNLMDVVCAVTALLEVDADGNPNVFSGSVTMTAEVATACGLDPDEVAGFNMPVVVEEVSGNQNYVRKLTVTTGTSRTIYWGKSAEAFALSFLYADANGGNSSYKGFYYENAVDKSTSFELQSLRTSGSPIDLDVFRILVDETVSPAVITAVGSFTDLGPTNNIRWSLQGDTSGTSDIAVSMSWKGQVNGDGSLATCVSPSTFAASGSSSTCGSFTAPDVGDFDTIVDAAYNVLKDKDETEYSDDFGADDQIDFDADEIVQKAIVI